MDASRLEQYGVTDQNAAAALVAAGFCLATIEPDARGVRPTCFLFAPDDRLAATLQQHHRGALRINPELYADAIRRLRPWANGVPVRTTLAPQHFGRRPAP
jgi:hypothetical protein